MTCIFYTGVTGSVLIKAVALETLVVVASAAIVPANASLSARVFAF